MRPSTPAALALVGALVAALAAARPATAAAQQSARPYIGQTLSSNPLALPLGFASGEYERAIGRRGLAVGVGGLTTLGYRSADALDYGDVYRSLEAKLKYYPSQNGLRGFAVGVTAGVAHTHTFQGSSSVVTVSEYGTTVVNSVSYATRTAPTLGATLDYNFLIGRERRFLIGLGVGAKSAVGGRRHHADPFDHGIADPRLQIGFGF